MSAIFSVVVPAGTARPMTHHTCASCGLPLVQGWCCQSDGSSNTHAACDHAARALTNGAVARKAVAIIDAIENVVNPLTACESATEHIVGPDGRLFFVTVSPEPD